MVSQKEKSQRLNKILNRFSKSFLEEIHHFSGYEPLPQPLLTKISATLNGLKKHLNSYRGWKADEPRPEVYEGMRLIDENIAILDSESTGANNQLRARVIEEIADQIDKSEKTVRNYLDAYIRFHKSCGEISSLVPPINEGYALALYQLQAEKSFNNMWDD